MCDLRETIDDGHPVNLFVVLALDVGAGQELEDGRAELDAIAVGKRHLPRHLLVVDVGAVGRAVVDHEPALAALLEVSVPSRNRIAVENDVIVGAAADARGAVLEHEAFAEERGLLRVDHDQAVVLFRRQRTAARGIERRRLPSSSLLNRSRKAAPYAIPLAQQVPPNSREVSATTLAIIGAREATWTDNPRSPNLSGRTLPDRFRMVASCRGGVGHDSQGGIFDFDVESNSTKYLFFRTSVKDPNREQRPRRAPPRPPSAARFPDQILLIRSRGYVGLAGPQSEPEKRITLTGR